MPPSPPAPALTLTFGGIAIAITCDDAYVRGGLTERFGAWRGPLPDRDADVTLEATVDDSLATCIVPEPVVHEAHGLHGVRARRIDLDGVVELAPDGTAHARFRIGGTPSALEGALRATLGVIVPARGALVLHAAAAADPRGGVAFLGPSGAGKSTIYALATRAPGWRQLSDEQVLVTPSPGGGFEVHAWPLGMAAAVPGARAPLRALCLLAHGPAPSMTPCPRERAAALLLGQVRVRLDPPWLAQRALDTAGRLLDEVPAWDLEFAPDPVVYGVVSVTCR